MKINKKLLFRKKMDRLIHDDSVRPEDEKICCPVCGKVLKEDRLDDVEYVKTKRGSEVFVHTKCVKNWGKG